jgi:uncharacterized protein (DUF608 family)
LATQIPYPQKDLFRPGKARVYRGRELEQIAFPLGGIGTGSISLGGWGQLRDFEIFNRSHKGLDFHATFFSLYAKRAGETAVIRVVQGPVGSPDLTGDGGGHYLRGTGAGLPHFRECEFEGAFPFARLRLEDPAVPLRVTLEAFNPFVPHNPDDSSLPAAAFHFNLHNPGRKPVKAVLFANLENKLGFPEGKYDGPPDPMACAVIDHLERDGVRGLFMSTKKFPPESPRFGTMCLATTHADTRIQTRWLRAGWFDAWHRFWDRASEGELDERTERADCKEGTDIGSIALRATVPPGRTVRLPVYICWHIPNFEMYWHWKPEGSKPIWKNWYATRYADAAAVAAYLGANGERLYGETREFADALFASTLPAAALDAVSSQISILKTNTCIRLPDGAFWAWEGCYSRGGCCAGTCTHVWNYAQTLAALFPTLERSIREMDYTFNLQDDGKMTFRMPLPPGTKGDGKFHAAADGQMGGIMKVYREWQNGAGDEWLRRLWPGVKKALEYAWKEWDRDKDGVMEGVQHNTYDIEWHGPHPR